MCSILDVFMTIIVSQAINHVGTKFVMRLIRVWRYQRGKYNPYFEDEQATQWPKEKVQKDRQRSTKHTHKTKDRVTWTHSIAPEG